MLEPDAGGVGVQIGDRAGVGFGSVDLMGNSQGGVIGCALAALRAGVRQASHAVCRVAEGGNEDEMVEGAGCHWADGRLEEGALTRAAAAAARQGRTACGSFTGWEGRAIRTCVGDYVRSASRGWLISQGSREQEAQAGQSHLYVRRAKQYVRETEGLGEAATQPLPER